MEQLAGGNFTLLLAVSLVTAAATILASAAYRALKANRLPPALPQDVRFTEKWASGTSHKNLLTRLGGARNCLSVTVSANALIVRPLPPFNLMFLPEVYDLEHLVPTSKIRSVEPSDEDSGRVLIEFESGGASSRLELVLREREQFLRALAASHAHGV